MPLLSLFLGFYQLWSLWGGFHRSIGFYFDPFRPDHSSEYSCEDDGFQTPRVARRELKITGWFPMATPNYHPIIVGFSITIHVWDPKSRKPHVSKNVWISGTFPLNYDFSGEVQSGIQGFFLPIGDIDTMLEKLHLSLINLVQELYSVEGLEGIYVYTYSFRIYLQHIWAICVTYAPTIVFHKCANVRKIWFCVKKILRTYILWP